MKFSIMFDFNDILIVFIKEKDTLSEYSYEYSTALLMNLSLRGAGKTKCEENKVKKKIK